MFRIAVVWFNQMTVLLASINTVRSLKDAPLDVKKNGDYAFWDYMTDSRYMRYQKARRVISQYPKIEHLLNWMQVV